MLELLFWCYRFPFMSHTFRQLALLNVNLVATEAQQRLEHRKLCSRVPLLNLAVYRVQQVTVVHVVFNVLYLSILDVLLYSAGDSLSVSLSLKSNETGLVFVPNITTVTLFDCQVHKGYAALISLLCLTVN